MNNPAVCRAALATVAVSWFQPWDLVLAVKDQILGAFSVAYLCVFASGVLVGSFFIPVIMVRHHPSQIVLLRASWEGPDRYVYGFCTELELAGTRSTHVYGYGSD